MEARLVSVAAAAGVLGESPAWGEVDDGPVWEGGADEEIEEEVEVVECSEAELLRLLDAAEPPLSTCGRLFFSEPLPDAQRTLLPASFAAQLRRRGWAVLPAFLSAELSRAAHAQALACPLLRPASELGHAGFTDISARGDTVYFLHAGEPPAAPGTPLGEVVSRLAALRNELSTLLRLSDEVEFQLAFYPGRGEGYARHRDAFPDGGEARQRRCTVVVYVNEPEWDVAVLGGALRLHAPAASPGEKGEGEEYEAACVDVCATHVDVAPAGGVCILFLSGAIEHEVLACAAPRVAVTAWCW